MPKLLQRKELSYLANWSTRTSRKPLVIRGARQVGKSTLVRQFASENSFSLLEINFERNPEYQEAFNSKDPAHIKAGITLLSGQKIIEGKTLLFLDELQAAPDVLATLRYFYEECPDLHVIAAGSLLEFALAKVEFSMPVGRIEYLHLGPMKFEDFMLAAGETELIDYLQNLSLEEIQNSTMLKSVHQKCMVLLKQYWIVGGLPEAINNYVSNHDFSDVSRIQQSIVDTYRDDFNKYSYTSSGTRQKQLVQLVFDQLPVMVGRKFKYTQISRDYRSAEISTALQQLCLARIAIKVHHSSANGIPLGAEVNQHLFKTLYLDIGLMCAALKLNVLDLNKTDLTIVNSGALAEQFIGQQLIYGSNYHEAPSLYYWVREAKSAAAEIDYLQTNGQDIIPVEIKAGTTGTLKSLHQFLKEKNRTVGLRFNADTPSLLKDTKKLSDSSKIDYKLLSLPLYMVKQSQRLIQDCLTLE